MTTMSTRNRRLWRGGALALAGLTLLAACGDGNPYGSSSTSPAASTPPTTAAAPRGGGSGDGYGDGYGYGGDVTSATEAPGRPAAAADGAPSIATAETSLGTVLVDAEGMTLYAFTKDTAGTPTCVDGCAEAWPPALVDGEASFGGLDTTVFSTVENPAGTQLKAGDFPLYTFAGDSSPGDVNGQGSGGNWFAVAPDGSLLD